MHECKDAGMKPLDLILVGQQRSRWIQHTRKSDQDLCAREYKTKKQGKIQSVLPAYELFSALPPFFFFEAVKVLCFNHDVSEFERTKESR